MSWRKVAFTGMLLVPLACFGNEPNETGADCELAYASLPQGAILDLLDPDAPRERRDAALQGYQRLAAMPQCPEFGYTLGLLHRHGPDLPGNLLPRDIQKARTWIRAMAEDGYLPAYADLAEMDMRNEAYRESMQWTQVYLHFVQNVQRPLADADTAQFQRSGYNGHLLTRAEVVWRWQKPSVPRKRVNEDLNAYLDAHGEAVGQRMRHRFEGRLARTSAQDGPNLRVRTGIGDCRLHERDRIGAATASWIVEVLPSGQTGRVVLENFVPSVAAADRLRSECLSRYVFEPFEGDEPRTIRLSLVYGSSEGASFRR